MDKLLNYILSLTNLYGLIHRDKVVEIYNLQNEDQIDNSIINAISKQDFNHIDRSFLEIHRGYFVAEAILLYDDFDAQLAKRTGKPFYIPEQEELLKYADDLYYEVTAEYGDLRRYIKEYFVNGDLYKADVICDNIQGGCQYGLSIDDMLTEFSDRSLEFEDEEQVSEVAELIVELANNTRIWENNGHTPNEMLIKLENSFPQRTKKIERNDPCPCGSGKKYKKCCLE